MNAMKKTDKVVLVMGATAPAPVAKPEPVKIVETKPEPEIESTKPVQAETKNAAIGMLLFRLCFTPEEGFSCSFHSVIFLNESHR